MMNDLIGHLHKVALRRDGGGLTDRQLLEGFLGRGDEAAFAALVRRHGPMVLGVCRRVLGNHHDAEDAFQATFLVLARRAAGLRARELVGNWLYGVAYRTALRARTMNARRRARERRPREPARPDDGWQELLPLLDQELQRLPERYRSAVVMCDLEGLTRREAARRLGVPEGTLSGRLTTAHRLLARRLARYGLAVSGGVLAAVLSERAASAGVSRGLASTTAHAAALLVGGETLAAGAVPARVVVLTEGVARAMLLSKLKTVLAVAFAVLVSAGAVGLTFRAGAAQAPPAPNPERTIADELEALRLEVQSLRKSVEANRERVRSLEAEVQALRGGQRAEGGAQPQKPGEKVFYDKQFLNNYYRELIRLDVKAAEHGDPLAEAEAALKRLREKPDDKQAAGVLEQALKRLKEQRLKEKPDGARKN